VNAVRPLRVVAFAFAWLAVVFQIVLAAIWAVGGFGDPPAYDPKADAVRAASGISVFFISLFAALTLTQLYREPRTAARRLVIVAVLLVAIGAIGDLLLGRLFGTPFFAILNVPLLVTALVLALGAVKAKPA